MSKPVVRLTDSKSPADMSVARELMQHGDESSGNRIIENKTGATRIKWFAECCCHEDSRKPCSALLEAHREGYMCAQKTVS